MSLCNLYPVSGIIKIFISQCLKNFSNSLFSTDINQNHNLSRKKELFAFPIFFCFLKCKIPETKKKTFTFLSVFYRVSSRLGRAQLGLLDSCHPDAIHLDLIDLEVDKMHQQQKLPGNFSEKHINTHIYIYIFDCYEDFKQMIPGLSLCH